MSLTSLLLNILRHRNLPFLLGEPEDGPKKERIGSEPLEQVEKDEKIEQQRVNLLKTMEDWQQAWRWWHYTKVYFAFMLWFLLPVSIIISTFYFYPLATISVPSVLMILALLILLAVNASPDCWRTSYKSLGTLLQV